MAIDERMADRVVEVLNEMLAIDPEATRALIDSRVPCDLAFADHPTIQVGPWGDEPCVVGILGVLNGLCGVHDGSAGLPG